MGDRDEHFRPLQGLPGKIYVPQRCGGQKHPCADCFQCQWCCDARCAMCRGENREPGAPGEEPDHDTNT